MTWKRAEFLTGYEIRALPARTGLFCFGAFDGCSVVAQITDADDRVALRRLVEVVYGIHSRRVLAAYRWRCAHCRRSRPLEIHHKRSRSLGGTHRVENLEPVCWDCHRRIHAHRQVIQPDGPEPLIPNEPAGGV
jgi:hypothetical protein